MMLPQSIIIDCDPGQDDAIALLLALACPEDLNLLAVTTVAGNVPLALTELNARKIVELSGRTDVPVYAGCERPILRSLVTAEYVHGETGLDGTDLPTPKLNLSDGHAVDRIIEILRDEPAKTVTLCPLGPLTNIALALIKAPDIVQRIDRIVLMGGAIGLGNVTAAAEFNFFVDPHAARVVFEAGVPITMLGLDVTHQALVTEARLNAISDIGSSVALAAAGLLDFYNRFDRDRYDAPGAPLHDPCVIAFVLKPEIFAGRDCYVHIESDAEATLGRSVVDWWQQSKRPANAFVVNEIKSDHFFDMAIDLLRRF